MIFLLTLIVGSCFAVSHLFTVENETPKSLAKSSCESINFLSNLLLVFDNPFYVLSTITKLALL